MLIAVASKDGLEVDQHFGHAERFLIFHVDGTSATQVDEKTVERYCSYDEAHPLRSHLLRAIADELQGCRAIVCSQVGQAPREVMSRLGFEVFQASGEIRPILIELSKLF